MAARSELGATGRETPDDRRRRVVAPRLAALDDRWYPVAIVVALVLIGIGIVLVPEYVPISLVFPVLVVAGVLLEPRRLGLVLAATGLVVAFWVPRSLLSPARVVGVIVAVAVVMGLVVVIARSRDRVGVRGFSGDRMFADLRDRIASVGQIPALPDGWSATSSILSAHGDRFSGDFVVAHLDASGDRLELALVDVSGKGTGAGTRSLLLSGALGGLLGAVPSTDFLSAANDYLVRQGWEEGFATAVHVELDLRTGAYSIANAGHPSPARYVSGRARWTVLDAGRGPLLGVIPGIGFPRQTGTLDRGDGLLIYSDGVVEARDRDLTDGIDRMLGVAAMSVLRDGDVARDVCESARSGEDDDRAALSVRRL
ncbi:serine/threonine-protein phosphatase [Phycicoccus sp. CSK15P-2]|uniref:PP2C family protein-serine/threonine phosphatase n=1 Tax=Phycicoccus sp. CSK15P-2 TaxID=2807627 RepID=UPI0019512743|nr:PP2C family protein-serine/threonine phosphatase [Phycicoccus sp. CSK15P-2]MBM6404246.1 serine/threonine-protein phosphatase [Phycicoccus sp. CSK15P-2]